MTGETGTGRPRQMNPVLITAIFLTLLSQMAWADEMPDKGKYSTMIKDSLDLNGADCRVQEYSVKAKTASKIIFSIKCTLSSYLTDIEVTCTQTSDEQCFVSRY